MSPLPTELVRLCVQFALSAATPSGEEPGESIKPLWKSIESITRSSKTFRSVALEAWFYRVYIQDPRDLKTLLDLWPESGQWARELHCVETSDTTISTWNLSSFPRLLALRLDLVEHPESPFSPSYIGAATHYPEEFRITHCPQPLVLDLRGLEWPSPMLLERIAALAPTIQVLQLRQELTWCTLCNTCTTPNFSPDSEGVTYKGGMGLSHHYNRVLASCPNLHTVHITVGSTGTSDVVLNDKSNENLWMGECESCARRLYTDKEFLDRCMSRKKGEDPNFDNTRPPSLSLVEWRFWVVPMVESDPEPLFF